VASSSHCSDSTAAILLSKFSKKKCTMLGDEELGRVYHAKFFALYAQRVQLIQQDFCLVAIFKVERVKNIEIAMVLSKNSCSFPSNSYVSATFSILHRFGNSEKSDQL